MTRYRFLWRLRLFLTSRVLSNMVLTPFPDYDSFLLALSVLNELYSNPAIQFSMSPN
jgi:hypothetical protein